ncbi:MAG: sirohydrochlorin cobaltochelatase [Lachnospiraceae bacterium]|jgi:sirohydrochlorin cobaltochelatase|nr:sirohydrochlorin cobaltochelatase [Lachnospiraceae bacterium]
MKLKKIVMLLAGAGLIAALAAGCGNAPAGGDAATGQSQESQQEESKDSQEPAEEPGEAPDSKEESEDSQESAEEPKDSQEPEGEGEAEGEEEENYETGDASLDDPRNQDEIGENELLAVSFGTSYNDNRRLTIGAIEGALESAFPDYSVRRGFTSQIIIDHVKKRDGEVIDNVTEALDRAVANGVRKLVVQPTHLMDGFEYNDLVEEVAGYADSFEQLAVGKPLLTSEEDFQAVMKAITEATAQYDDGETAICFMGHGTEADSNQVYAKMQEVLKEAGFEHYYVGTVEASPSLEDVLAAVKAGEYKRVVLRPLMVVAGDHANNDMAGEEEDTWKTAFESAGYEVECVVEGLGGLEAIQQLFVAHAQAAADSLSGSGE